MTGRISLLTARAADYDRIIAVVVEGALVMSTDRTGFSAGNLPVSDAECDPALSELTEAYEVGRITAEGRRTLDRVPHPGRVLACPCRGRRPGYHRRVRRSRQPLVPPGPGCTGRAAHRTLGHFNWTSIYRRNWSIPESHLLPTLVA
jgi:hypothetical protein